MLGEINLLGLKFSNLTAKECLSAIEGFIESGSFHYITGIDMHRMVDALKDNELKLIYKNADLAIPDGMGIVWASRILGCPLKERVSCPDLADGIFRLSSQKHYRIFIFKGGDPALTKRAVENIKIMYPGVNIRGVYTLPYEFDPRIESSINRELINEILEKKPHIILFALGCPKEELWIWREKEKLKDIPVCLGIGGAMDIYAGRVKRAPKWMQRCGLEWLFRIAQEPGRLYKRYLVSIPAFAMAILNELTVNIKSYAKKKPLIMKIYTSYQVFGMMALKDISQPHKVKLIYGVKPYTPLSYARLSKLYELAEYSQERNIRGSFVECGVYNGGSAAIIASVSQTDINRQIWLFDSWEGIPEPQEIDVYISGIRGEKGMYAGSIEKTKELFYEKLKLGNKNNIHFIKGWFKETIPAQKKSVGKIALLHLDCDWYESIKTCLQGLYESVVEGGFVVIDDYFTWRGCRKAVDEFIENTNPSIKLTKIDNFAVYFKKNQIPAPGPEPPKLISAADTPTATRTQNKPMTS